MTLTLSLFLFYFYDDRLIPSKVFHGNECSKELIIQVMIRLCEQKQGYNIFKSVN